jgi:hypothetical protein
MQSQLHRKCICNTLLECAQIARKKEQCPQDTTHMLSKVPCCQWSDSQEQHTTHLDHPICVEAVTIVLVYGNKNSAQHRSLGRAIP